MRNVLAHGYNIVDFGKLHATIRDDLPPLIVALRDILARRGDPADRLDS